MGQAPELTQLFKELDQTPDPVVALNARGEVVFANDAAEELFGYPDGLLNHRPARDLFPMDGPRPNVDLAVECSRFGRREFGRNEVAHILTAGLDRVRVVVSLDTFVTVDDIITPCAIEVFGSGRLQKAGRAMEPAPDR